MSAERKSHLELVVDNKYPVGNRKSRDLVELKLVAANDFSAVARQSAETLGAKYGVDLSFMVHDDTRFDYLALLDNKPDPWAPKK